MSKRRAKAKGWKALCLILALVLVIATVLGVLQFCTPAGKKLRPSEWFSKTEAPKPQEETGGLEILPDEGNGIALMSAEIAREAYAENGISEEADGAKRLTATVTPANADDVYIEWSVNWIDLTNSAVANLPVTDYVTITPTEEGALTANAVCLQAFPYAIQIKATLRNTAYSASCRVDYIKKVDDFSISGFYLIKPNLTSPGASPNREPSYKLIKFNTGDQSAGLAASYYDFQQNYQYGEGTITPTLETDCYFEMTEKGLNRTGLVNYGISPTSYHISTNIKYQSDFWAEVFGVADNEAQKETIRSRLPYWAETYYVANTLDTEYTEFFFQLRVEWSFKYNGTVTQSGTAYMGVNIDASALKVNATGLALDETELYY